MSVELQYTELQERYRTRVLYAISSDDAAQATAELEDALHLTMEWKALVDEADAVDASLEGVKRKFSETTRQQVSCQLYSTHCMERNCVTICNCGVLACFEDLNTRQVLACFAPQYNLAGFSKTCLLCVTGCSLPGRDGQSSSAPTDRWPWSAWY